jgi:hypothetical protein
MRMMTARKWNKGDEEYWRRLAQAPLQPLRESLFSSRINVLVRRVPALQSSLAFKRCKNPDKSISYSERSLWPARCNTTKRHIEKQVV